MSSEKITSKNIEELCDNDYLNSIPGMKESIINESNIPLSECSKELE